LQRRFEGTRVTVESFLAWKSRFDAEMGTKKIQDKEEKETRKLTGKELFLTDKTLIESDLKFLEDGKYLYLMECPSLSPSPLPLLLLILSSSLFFFSLSLSLFFFFFFFFLKIIKTST
jgi:hypothetical protein